METQSKFLQLEECNKTVNLRLTTPEKLVILPSDSPEHCDRKMWISRDIALGNSVSFGYILKVTKRHLQPDVKNLQ